MVSPARWLPVPLLAAGVIAFAVSVACGDRDEDPPAVETASAGASATTSPTTQAPATTGTASAVEPLLDPPVSQYTILVQDLGIQNFLTDLETTGELDAEDYAASTTFASAADGAAKLADWGYVEGYRTGLIPEGGSEAMLNGAYVVYQEIHLYESTDGAHGAFQHIAGNVSSNAAAEQVNTSPVANESIASRAVAGKVSASDIDQVLHQVVFRRGNVVTVLLTIGAEPLMKIDTALELAAIVDEKMLGEREHPQPTPIPERSPSPSATVAP